MTRAATKPAKRRGRPPVAGQPASSRLHVRATPAELEQYRAAAGRAGLPLSAWIRAALSSDAPVARWAELTPAERDRIAQLVNHLASYANSGERRAAIVQHVARAIES